MVRLIIQGLGILLSLVAAIISTNRFNAINSASSVIQLGGPLTIVNGENANFDQLVELAETYTTSISKPSDLQVVSTIPIAIGDGTSDVSFSDSEKSLAFPQTADGANTFQNYLASLVLRLTQHLLALSKSLTRRLVHRCLIRLVLLQPQVPLLT